MLGRDRRIGSAAQGEAMTDFRGLLASVARRPAMYVGSCSRPAVANLLAGYCLAVEHLGLAPPLDGWMRWVELRFGVFHPAWNWTRILLHGYGSDAAAIAALPELFEEFEAEHARLGVEGILTRHGQEFTGSDGLLRSRVPETTTTREPAAN
jgi:hypothetical protein